jgi:hypothetical protein
MLFTCLSVRWSLSGTAVNLIEMAKAARNFCSEKLCPSRVCNNDDPSSVFHEFFKIFQKNQFSFNSHLIPIICFHRLRCSAFAHYHFWRLHRTNSFSFPSFSEAFPPPSPNRNTKMSCSRIEKYYHYERVIISKKDLLECVWLLFEKCLQIHGVFPSFSHPFPPQIKMPPKPKAENFSGKTLNELNLNRLEGE